METAAPIRHRLPLAWACGVAMLLYAFYLGAIGVLLPALGAEFQLGKEVQGRLFPANFSGFVIGVLLCGGLSDHFGRKAVLIGGTLLYAGGLVLFGIAPQFAWILPAAAMVGGGSGAMEVVASAMAGDLYPEKRALLLSAIQIAFGAGAVVGPVVARALLEAGTGWRPLFLGIAVANLVLPAMVAPFAVPRPAAHEGVSAASLRRIVGDAAFRRLCLALFLYVGGEVACFSWLPSFLKDRIAGGAAWTGIASALFWIGMTVGRFATSALVHRFRTDRLAAALAGAGAVAGALLPFSPTGVAVAVVATACGLCFSGVFGLVLAEAADRFPGSAGSVLGGVVAAGGAGGAGVPWVVAAVSESRLGWTPALLLIPVSLAGCALLLARLPRRASVPAADPA